MGIKDFFRRKKEASLCYSVQENLLVLTEGESFLPPRCIYCNSPVNKLAKISIYNGGGTLADC